MKKMLTESTELQVDRSFERTPPARTLLHLYLLQYNNSKKKKEVKTELTIH